MSDKSTMQGDFVVMYIATCIGCCLGSEFRVPAACGSLPVERLVEVFAEQITSGQGQGNIGYVMAWSLGTPGCMRHMHTCMFTAHSCLHLIMHCGSVLVITV